jgi:hypothetical protein
MLRDADPAMAHRPQVWHSSHLTGVCRCPCLTLHSDLATLSWTSRDTNCVAGGDRSVSSGSRWIS